MVRQARPTRVTQVSRGYAHSHGFATHRLYCGQDIEHVEGKMVERASYPTMTDHPDVVEMRERYERISAKQSAAITDGLIVLAGLWLAISPWVIHFNRTQPEITASNLILGLAVAAI